MKNLDVTGLNVSRETIAALEAFAALTTKWTAKINLIAPSTISDIWNRHIVDSAQMYRFVPSHYTRWTDLGSGGGFPGIVAAIIARELHPNARFTLIESDQRKAIFLRTAARELDLNISVLPQRIENCVTDRADIVSARALMAFKDLLPHLVNYLEPDGIALLHKGRRYADEITAAQSDWAFDLAEYPSITDPEARILTVKRIIRA